MVRITQVQPLDGFAVRLTFTDGTRKEIDLRPYLRGPVFAPMLRDTKAFRAVYVDPQLGTIVWPNGADLDPDVLYGGLTPAWQERHAADASR